MSTAHWLGHRRPIPAAWLVRSSPAVHQWAIISAALAPILLHRRLPDRGRAPAGLLQPDAQNHQRDGRTAGTDRWIMTGGIALVAGCYLVNAAGLTGVRTRARALLIFAGLAGIGIAASPVPASGAAPRHLA
jgi:hypothetical protein